MNAEINKRIKALGSVEDSPVARILRASEQEKKFLMFYISTEAVDSFDPRIDRISRIGFCLASSDLGILEGGHFSIRKERTFPEACREIASMYPEQETVLCTYGIFEAWRFGAEIDRFRDELTDIDPGRFRQAISVEYAAASLLGIKPGEDRSLKSVMETLEIEPFDGRYDKTSEDIHILLVLQELFRGTIHD